MRQFLCSAVVFVSLAAVLHADGPSPQDRRDALKYGWIYDDFDAAVAKAKESDKPILAVLRCPP